MQHQLQPEDEGLLGALCPGKKKLLGKTFYLDNVKKRPTALILETISFLGGGVESFLHKDVSFVVTGSPEYLKQSGADTKVAEKGSNDGAQQAAKTREGVLSKEKQRPGAPRPMICGSRGKALLEKAIRNNELHKSSVLSNAQSWGVKILYVDDVLLYLKCLTQESFSVTHKRPEKTYSKQRSHVVKAAALKSPYLKIEDVSRKYKPLHMQSLTFPSLWYPGRFSPFDPPPPEFEKQNKPAETRAREEKRSKNRGGDRPATPLSCGPSPLRPRRKDQSYCECCHQHFSNQEEHLQSDRHRAFVLDASNYAVVDRLVAEMVPGFRPRPPSRPEDAGPVLDAGELEPVGDLEAEREVRALRRRGSSLCDGLSSPSPHASLTLPLPPTPPVLSPGIIGDRIAGPSSPAMPVLAVEGRGRRPGPSPPSEVPCPSSPDPYSHPPVLSPQVLYATEPHSPYSEPPVLSPEQTPVGHACETDPPQSPPPDTTKTQRRSRSLPQPAAVAVARNPKKRCRSASPGQGRPKKRRHADRLASPRDPPAGTRTPAPPSPTDAIESALIPDLAALSSPSSDSDWDRDVGVRTPAAPPSRPDRDLELDKDLLLHRRPTWLPDSSYESRLHTALQPSVSGKPPCGEDTDSSAFSRTVVTIVEVQH